MIDKLVFTSPWIRLFFLTQKISRSRWNVVDGRVVGRVSYAGNVASYRDLPKGSLG